MIDPSDINQLLSRPIVYDPSLEAEMADPTSLYSLLARPVRYDPSLESEIAKHTHISPFTGLRPSGESVCVDHYNTREPPSPY